MNDVRASAEVGPSSDRAFGFVFATVMLIIAIWPLFFGGHPRVPFLAAAIGFAVLAVGRPSLLAPLNRVWTKFGLVLHRITNPIILGLMFFAVITPFGLVMRVFRADPLNRKYDAQAKSYWVQRDRSAPGSGTLKDQF